MGFDLDIVSKAYLCSGVQAHMYPQENSFFHLGPLCLTLPYLPYGHFRGGPPAGRTAYSHLLPLWTPHAVRLWQLLAIGGRIENNQWVLLSLSKFDPWPVPVSCRLWVVGCGLWAMVFSL
jgi:hypothetical protein